MREIEFRAWLKNEKKMVNVKSIHLGRKKVMYGYSESPQNYGNKTCSFQDCELMQYTGKKDKNGTKIFESDIVLVDEYEQALAVIRWDEDCGCFYIQEDNLYLTFDEYYSYELEVVGNVFDNPELLGDGDDIKE